MASMEKFVKWATGKLDKSEKMLNFTYWASKRLQEKSFRDMSRNPDDPILEKKGTTCLFTYSRRFFPKVSSAESIEISVPNYWSRNPFLDSKPWEEDATKKDTNGQSGESVAFQS
jgi:hypothetical protein